MSVKGILLKALCSFGKSEKNVCTWVSLCIYNKFAGFFGKAAVNFIYIVLLSTNKNQKKYIIWVGEGAVRQNIFKKAYMVKSKREFFLKWKKFIQKYTIFIFAFKGPKKFIFWYSWKAQIPYFYFSGTKQSEDTHGGISTLPLLVKYIFNEGVHNFILKNLSNIS